MDASGLTVEKEVGRGEAKRTETRWIAAPFEVLGACRDPHGGRLGQGAAMARRRRALARAACRRRRLARRTGGALRRASRDLRLADRPDAPTRFRRLSFAPSGAKRRVTVVSRTGWHEIGGRSVFVLPGETIGPARRRAGHSRRGGAGAYEARGTIEDWRDGVAKLASGHVVAGAGDFRRAGRPAVAPRRHRGRRRPFLRPSSKGKTTLLQIGGERLGPGRNARLCPHLARDGERIGRRGGRRDRYRA